MEVRDINDVDRHDSLHWELYWYIFDKKNPDLLNGQTVSVSDVQIKRPDNIFDEYDNVDYWRNDEWQSTWFWFCI